MTWLVGWRARWSMLPVLVCVAYFTGGGRELIAARPPGVARTPMLLNDDGGWSWFEDERAIVVGKKLFVGSVAMGSRDPVRKGDIEITGYDLRTGRVTRFPLHKRLEGDDHDSPALLALPDGRLLAMYSRHGTDNRIHTRISRLPGDATAWEPERVCLPSQLSRVTYSNLHWLRDEGGGRNGRIYDFFRGYDAHYKPSWMISDDASASWKVGGLLIDVPGSVRHRPYVKYASDGRGTIHFVFTEGHPRDFDNGIHHAFLRGGKVHRADGTAVGVLREGPIVASQATQVYAGGSDHVAWIQDVALDRDGSLRAVWSVQLDSAGLPRGQGGQDHRYHWAKCVAGRWEGREIAFAGGRLYAGEDDYTGGICLHPDEPDVVFLSTNVNPASGEALPGGFHQLFRGRRDRGGAWSWEALTPGVTESQLRPIVPKWTRGRTALLWLQGTYRAYQDYDLRVMCWVDPLKRRR